MAGQDDDSDKPFEPTARKLQEARKKGDVAKSQDLNTTASYIGLFLALSIGGSGIMMHDATGLMVLLDQGAQLAPLFFDGRAAAPIGQMVQGMTGFLTMLLLIPAAAVLLSMVAQRSITFAPSKLAPKLNRISPISIAKQKFGITGLFEFFKSFLKLTIFSVCLGIFINAELPRIVLTPRLEAAQSMTYLADIFIQFLSIVIVVSAVIGAVDYLFQYNDHRRKLMMSRKEIMDEMKDSEGDPHLKQERRQRGRDRALNQTLKNVETADVVITNPTHYAVALHWSRLPGEAPKCVAKGTDETARAIRERAMEHAVPIHEDPPTARALHATVDIDQEIPRELYQAVAAAIRFSESMRNRAQTRPY
ncbi:flagellar biosynthesis protein FlhB [Aliishimia ponticola]|uniref:Flagellar biosynthesis protein FlhB n=1 Tax=Aliishimia ponticola TaxID=2499833 RepID=A0A4V3XJX7_9RHOB|nr:flagellar type III secretion system protein FlhB [Aliishimia ponticola]THH34793.1 flagellar biosynthesis protein FlhB [Aliishimia ponticola]